MKPRKRIFWLILIMVISIVLVASLTFNILYKTTLEEKEFDLLQFAKSQATLIEAIYEHSLEYHSPDDKDPVDYTLDIIRDSHENFPSFGDTGEFTMAKREDDMIVFLLKHRHSNTEIPEPVPYSGELAEPMQAALANESGVMVGKDYRGEMVIAAYEPIEVLGWGFVAKTDRSELIRPFITALGISIMAAIGLSIIGAYLFIRVSNPLVRNLENYSIELEHKVESRTKKMNDMQDAMIRNESLAALGKLAGGVGHELRNPLSVISNAVYFLAETQTDIDEKAKYYLDIIKTEVNTSERIIADLLDFGRVTTTKIEETNIEDIVNDSIRRITIPDNIELQIVIDPNANEIIGDHQQICQVVSNLITNAYQEMPDGGNLILKTSTLGDEVKLDIIDNGPGISEENQKNIFEPLFTTKPRGVGLGLAISKKLVESNHGEISFSSKPGEGTIFTLILQTEMKGGQQ